MLVLGLETSCDETAVGIVCDDPDPNKRILANVVASQFAEHKPYGGVVPEIAARAHLDRLDDLVREALKSANITLDNIEGVAATCGPGLIGGVMVGAMTGKAIAAVRKLPFVAVNHLEAHALTVRLTNNVEFPYLFLLATGGHCQLLFVKGVSNYRLLGSTIDDAIGECFDKSAKLLGLGYPGGPQIEIAALNGNPRAFDLPRPMLGRPGCDFSFAGLKTAVRKVAAATELSPSSVSDIAASLQTVIADIIVDRTNNAFNFLDDENLAITALVVAGGVASNQFLRSRLADLALKHKVPFIAPPLEFCTDNGVMVAWTGIERLRLGLFDDLSVASRPRWPLESIQLT